MKSEAGKRITVKCRYCEKKKRVYPYECEKKSSFYCKRECKLAFEQNTLTEVQEQIWDCILDAFEPVSASFLVKATGFSHTTCAKTLAKLERMELVFSYYPGGKRKIYEVVC